MGISSLILRRGRALGAALARAFLEGGGGGGLVGGGGVLGEGRTCAFAQLLDEFEGEGTTGTFVSIDSGCHEYEIGSDEVANKG